MTTVHNICITPLLDSAFTINRKPIGDAPAAMIFATIAKTIRRSISVDSKLQMWCPWLTICSLVLICSTTPIPSQATDAHLGLPPVVTPAENPTTPAKIALGQSLFFDKRLSRDGSTSCASCHQPQHAFSDAQPLAKGIAKRVGTRNTPSIINVAFNTSQFWDGRRITLESQALDPLINPNEHGLQDVTAVLNLLRRDRQYIKAFRTAFDIGPNGIRAEHVGQAMASFERSLIAGNSAFDRFAYKNEKSSLSPSAARGLALFQGSAQCANCHTIGKRDALFADNQFHSLSIGLKRIEHRLPEITMRLVQARQQGANLDQTVLSNEDIAELGRFAVTLAPTDIGKFRTPSLRNVALTAPYMHDGSVATLEEAVEMEIYYRSAEAGRPLILTPIEKTDLVEFLKALTSPEIKIPQLKK